MNDGIHNEQQRMNPIDIEREKMFDRLQQQSRIEEMPRMATTRTDAMTESQRRSIRDRIKEACVNFQLTNNRLAKMVNQSPSVISQVLKGKYPGDTDAVLSKLEDAIVAEYQRKAATSPRGEFVMTSVAREIYTVIHMANKYSAITVMHGPSGIGKSHALKAISRTEYSTAIYIEANDGCRSVLGMYRTILRVNRKGSFDVSGNGKESSEGVWSRGDAFNSVVAILKDSYRMILIDEADVLPLETLNAIRQIHDATGCPVVFCGRPPLEEKLRRSRKCESIGGSLVGRIMLIRDLLARTKNMPGGDDGEQLFTVEDIARMLQRYKVRVNRKAQEWLTAMANITALGDDQGELMGLRYAVYLFTMAHDANLDADEITVEILERANSLMLGSRFQPMNSMLVREWIAKSA